MLVVTSDTLVLSWENITCFSFQCVNFAGHMHTGTTCIQITSKQLLGAFEHIMYSRFVVNGFIHASIITAIEGDRVTNAAW